MPLMHSHSLRSTARAALTLAGSFVAISIALFQTAQSSDRVNTGWLMAVSGNTISTPSFPGSDHYSFVSYPSLSVASPGTADSFIAPDDSLSVTLFSANSDFSLGAVSRYDENRASPMNPASTDHRWAFEPGVFAEYWPSNDAVRVRGEVRMGADDFSGVTGTLGADFVQRIGKFIFSAGPRMSLSGTNYANAQYSDAAAAFGAGRNEVGSRSLGAAGLLKFASGNSWTTAVYANYDRVLNPAAATQANRPLAYTDEVTVGAAFNFVFPTPTR